MKLVPSQQTHIKMPQIKLIHLKRDFKNLHFPQKWILEGILPVKVKFSTKTKMVRMVHMNTFRRMDLEKMEI